MLISDWSSDVCSSDLHPRGVGQAPVTWTIAKAGLAPSSRLTAAAPRRGTHRQAAGWPTCRRAPRQTSDRTGARPLRDPHRAGCRRPLRTVLVSRPDWLRDSARRSEEHTSELQSLMRISYAVFCLKKKKQTTTKKNKYR